VTLALPALAGRQLGGRAGTAAAVSALLACLVLVLGGAGWRLTGGSWAVIETPSMGRAAPVGTLILTRPAALEHIQVGDVVTYRPRNAHNTLYTHRVVTKYPDSTVQVQGDINGTADPFPVGQEDLVGKVVARWVGVGWLVRALPTVLLAMVVLLVATGRYVPLRWRSSVRILGACLVFAVTSLLLRPFVHPILIAVTDNATGQQASVVSGGLLPIRVTGSDGGHIDLSAGETGVVQVAARQAGGALMVNGSPHLTGWWLVASVGVSLLPMLWCAVVGLVPAEEDRP
jgi:signal peptidase I